MDVLNVASIGEANVSPEERLVLAVVRISVEDYKFGKMYFRKKYKNDYIPTKEEFMKNTKKGTLYKKVLNYYDSKNFFDNWENNVLINSKGGLSGQEIMEELDRQVEDEYEEENKKKKAKRKVIKVTPKH